MKNIRKHRRPQTVGAIGHEICPAFPVPHFLVLVFGIFGIGIRFRYPNPPFGIRIRATRWQTSWQTGLQRQRWETRPDARDRKVQEGGHSKLADKRKTSPVRQTQRPRLAWRQDRRQEKTNPARATQHPSYLANRSLTRLQDWGNLAYLWDSSGKLGCWAGPGFSIYFPTQFLVELS